MNLPYCKPIKYIPIIGNKHNHNTTITHCINCKPAAEASVRDDANSYVFYSCIYEGICHFFTLTNYIHNLDQNQEKQYFYGDGHNENNTNK